MSREITLSVSHATTYRYSMPVETAQHLATIRPLANAWQRIVSHSERIEPAPAYETSHIDAFGNEVLYFSFDTPHESLSLTSETTVVLSPRWQGFDPGATPAWEEVAHALGYRAGGQYLPETEFVFASPNVALGPALRTYALESFVPGAPLAAAAIDLMHRIHAEFAYDPQATAFDTPALRAFEARHGVCQDFAQVMIGCLRSLGLAARYVSGYLRTEPPKGAPRLIGADASHAWASVFCPGLGWIDLDPTNDVLADLDHVTLAVGRDYTDVSLLRGIILGGGEHSVDVAVSVVQR
ncbi:transglutaminase family protein [Trinickia caryophylli]|uniref:Transglutaminase-like enzyme, putative cysteine protease n=1 Tax=Trinickia caryophylli TaxID=28094 RepID=A0A1X7CGG4_TRICW|nr:transglutaminase family protein [Trinickia caryophylli]PMS11595.1 transglutaminase family protein [Trinickia caryophylli]TRX19847.1 transglutaminase family protein [Trinickia caryophylli]WQE12820.1 transglutaminase family protein [Trinickia caryophylli]SME95918.1 Transglutaminase-like enzyme, putative cysteine protease [Trinickia caryophylli]GLU30541.1 transglutaminase [Trinickia caryophylli]